MVIEYCTCLHPPNLHGYKLTEKQKWYHLGVHLHTSIQNVKELPYHARAWHILQEWHFKRPHPLMASCWTNLQASSMLQHFAYISIKLFPTKEIDSQPLWTICSWAHLPSSSARTQSTCIQHPHKSDRVTLCNIWRDVKEVYQIREPIGKVYQFWPICKVIPQKGQAAAHYGG